jgi:transcriptional regulator of acetoin/glycerol metabolism
MLARKLQQAQGGTLWLADVGEMPVSLQAELLRLLQAGQFTPLGGDAPVALDVAWVCTTRSPLLGAGFDASLLHHLNGLAVTLPPLWERSDLGALVQRLLPACGATAGAGVSDAAMALLAAHRWPGNLRQLRNVLRAAVLLAGPAATVLPEHLPDEFAQDACDGRPATAAAAAFATRASADPQAAASLQDLELAAVRAAVDAAGGNISVAARQLGVSRNTVYRKLRLKA